MLAIGAAGWLGLVVVVVVVALAGGGLGAARVAALALTGVGLALAFAFAIDGADWLRYFTLFRYYGGDAPLPTGLHLGSIAVLVAVALALTAAALAGFRGRDLRLRG